MVEPIKKIPADKISVVYLFVKKLFWIIGIMIEYSSFAILPKKKKKTSNEIAQHAERTNDDRKFTDLTKIKL